MAELVEDLGDPERRREIEPVAGREELVKLGQLGTEGVEVDEHQEHGTRHEHQRGGDRRR